MYREQNTAFSSSSAQLHSDGFNRPPVLTEQQANLRNGSVRDSSQDTEIKSKLQCQNQLSSPY